LQKGHQKFNTLRRVGIRRATQLVLGRLHSLPLYGLQRIYRFHPWHAEGSWVVRPYKKAAVRLVNALEPETVVDLGCGLGDMLCRIKAKNRYGIDPDPGAIRAAKLLHPWAAVWVQGDATCIPQVIKERPIDCLLMSGWIHMISPQQLEEVMQPLLPRTRYLVVDALTGYCPPHLFRHDFAFLSGRAERISQTVPVNDTVRAYYVYKTLPGLDVMHPEQAGVPG
jgi:ubiquinone/menaquinone biosynthesis C-methylase UbiE